MTKTLEEMQRELQERDMPKITKDEIKEYNAKPEVKERGAKLVTISSDRFKTYLVWILVGFLVCAGVFAYLAYSDKLKLLNIDIPACPAAPAAPACPACPTQPKCPDCSPNVYVNATCTPTLRCTNSS